MQPRSPLTLNGNNFLAYFKIQINYGSAAGSKTNAWPAALENPAVTLIFFCNPISVEINMSVR